MSKDASLKDLIIVRYADHVVYSRSSALTMKPQIRQAVGWLIYECEQYVTLAWDQDIQPPTLKGGDSKASGLVLLKTDILELKRLNASILPLQKNSEWQLNSSNSIVNDEYALQSEKRKTHLNKKKRETAK